MTGRKILIMPGCETCETGKKKGMCKENTCIDSTSDLGKKIEKEAKVTLFPECVVQKKDNKWKKCNVKPILKKYIE